MFIINPWRSARAPVGRSWPVGFSILLLRRKKLINYVPVKKLFLDGDSTYLNLFLQKVIN